MKTEDIEILNQYKELLATPQKTVKWNLINPSLLTLAGVTKIALYYYFKDKLIASNPPLSKVVVFALEWSYMSAVGAFTCIFGIYWLAQALVKNKEQEAVLVLVNEALRKYNKPLQKRDC